MSYFSLHTHSDFSNTKFPDSINKVEHLIDYCHEIGLNGVALTDHDCITGHVSAEKHLAKQKKKHPDDPSWQNFKLLLGNEIYLCRNGMNKDNYIKGEDKFFHFILIAKDEIGHRQIRELSTRAWKRSYMYFHRRVPTYYQDLEDIVSADPGHLFASSACLGGWVDTYLLKAKENSNHRDEIHEGIFTWIRKMQSIFGEENFYLELQPGLSKEQIYVNKAKRDISKKLGIPCIITTDAHFTNTADRPVHKAYLTSREGDREVDEFYEVAYLMTEEEILERMMPSLGDEDFIGKCLENTNDIGRRCKDFSLLKPLKIPYLPQKEKELDPVPLMEHFDEILDEYNFPSIFTFFKSKEPADQQLLARVLNFVKTAHGDKRTLLERVEFELEIVWESGEKQNPKVSWSKYLVQMADYTDIFWNEGDSFICPGRGSGAASYLLCALGITQVDPTREKAPLLFQRFMNPDRASVLDIDIDLESTKRNKCINALQDKYGEFRVVRVGTIRTEKAKSAILAAGRSIGMDIDEARYIASLVGAERGNQYTLSEMYYGNEERELKPNSTFIREMNKNPRLWEIARRVEGLVTGLGVHAGGVLIVDEPFTNTNSIVATSKGEFISAFDLHASEDVGNIKIDALATEGLAKLRVCVDLLCEHGFIEKEATLRETYEKVVGVYNIDRTTDAMWEMIWDNKIISLFQMEQQSGVQGIALTKPKNLESLAALNSVMRLMGSERGAEQPLEKYARFREDPTAWEREMVQHGLTKEERDLMRSMLSYSSGLCAHQEDLYQLLTHPQIAGFSLGDADLLRKAVAKKSPEDYDRFEIKFWKAVEEKGVSQRLAHYVWDVLVATQRGYSFK